MVTGNMKRLLLLNKSPIEIFTMKLVLAFFRMIRLPNLFFIVLTQFLFYFCIVSPILEEGHLQPKINASLLIILVIASVFIAAAGYIINDYFDINIDNINKPQGNVVDKIVSRRWAMALHFILSGTGIVLSSYISWKTGLWYIIVSNFICVFLLFGYSVSLKKRLLSGNVVISLLTAWVIMILCLAEINLFDLSDRNVLLASNKIIRLGFIYAGFAFISSLIREAIKDIEDMQGDEKFGCKTMPIVWGVNAAKVYIAVWLIVLIAVVIILQVYIMQFHWWWPVIYSILLIILPLCFIFYRLFRASGIKHYHRLSTLTKLVMLSGILSMIFFYFYL